ncbi:PLP-dependent transferase [Liquorilactobacillus cacaonum]|uniref:Cys Met metabolism pyridoxal-phosphate-dependent protein n=1 Tax=Liquorilactobacillus cacaonum DSM 21116 TaxID=1423729 RepID=A0A0R2CEV3_9LACO|nr:Cys Met metabolism pyridoxal-phosphate-dependent protein [Liquorilactobacillus cacaonum DSM 21116]
MEKYEIETLLAQAGNHSQEDPYGTVSTPIYLSSNFRHGKLSDVDHFDYEKQYAYSRMANPTRKVLEQTLALLEEGTRAFALSSGMAAIQLVFSLFKSGDEIISTDDLYGGTFRYFDHLNDHFGLNFSQWNGKDIADLKKLITAKTVAIWIETPSNPTMKEVDLVAIATFIHNINSNIKIIVDNTFYTPIYQKPLTLGADIVVHSATKYLSGHNDLLGGAVVCKGTELTEKLIFNFNTTGAVLDPFDSWLLLRSLKTLPLRMRQHTENAQAIFKFLSTSPAVSKVLYPGVGGMISFYLKDSSKLATFFDNLKIISFAESLGGVESLVTLPAKQTHHDMPIEQREHLGITDNLLRLSVGLENSKDLITELKKALE